MNIVQPKPKSRKRKIILIGVSVVAIAVTCSPVSAQIAAKISRLSSIFGAFGVDIAPYLEYIQAAEDFYQAVSTGNLKEILEGSTVAAGELGIPIPTEVQKVIDEVTDQTDAQAGAFGVESSLLNQVLQGQADYKIAQSSAEALLGEEGQRRIADSKEMTAEAAAASAQASQTAQGENITQEVMKQIAVQNTSTTAILKSIYDSAVDDQIVSTQTYQALGNMSKALTEEAWGKRITGQASQIGLMDTIAQYSALVSPRTEQ